MFSYLGPHLNLIANCDAFFAKAKPRIAKVLLPTDIGRLQTLAQLSPDTVWIGRIVLDDQNLDNPAQSGRELGERIIETARRYPAISLWEGYNEPDTSTREALAAYAEHEIQRTLTLHRAGLKSIVGNFSTGTPEISLWPFFYPALEYGDALGLHEYDAPGMRRLSSWLCGRFVRVYGALPAELRKPLIVSECGIDGGVLGDGRAGWKRYMDASGYMAELTWYDRLLMQCASRWPILGATIFGWWGRGGYTWDEYDIDGALATLLRDYIVSTRRKPLTIWRRFVEWLERIIRR